MTFTAVRRCLSAVALFSVLALVAACTGSGSTLLSPTGPSASVNRSLAVATIDDPCATPTLRGNITTVDEVPPEVPPPDPCATGRFTGGGFQINFNDVKVTRGFTLHCDAILSNNFEVNWKAGGTTNNFHIDKNQPVVSCTLLANPNPPDAPVNRIHIIGTGSLNGVEGATVELVLIDNGEKNGAPAEPNRLYDVGHVSSSNEERKPWPEYRVRPAST